MPREDVQIPRTANAEAAHIGESTSHQLHQTIAQLQQELQLSRFSQATSNQMVASMKAYHESAMADLIDLKDQHLQKAEEAIQQLQQKEAQLQQVTELFRESQAEFDKKLAAAKVDHESAIASMIDQQTTAIAELKSQHAAEAKRWEDATARLEGDSNDFKYSVRGCTGPLLSGLVPRSIFGAEPESALTHMYNGKWEYPRDEQGRAVVNSDPGHWPLILNWLSFGAVPSNPSDGLIAECRYWQLEGLLAAMQSDPSSIPSITQAADDSHHLNITPFTADGHTGFKVNGKIHHIPKRLAKAVTEASSFSLPFSAIGRDWCFTISQAGFFLTMLTELSITKALWEMRLGSGSCTISQSCSEERLIQAGRGWGWLSTAGVVASIVHPRMLSIEGSIELEFTVTIK